MFNEWNADYNRQHWLRHSPKYERPFTELPTSGKYAWREDKKNKRWYPKQFHNRYYRLPQEDRDFWIEWLQLLTLAMNDGASDSEALNAARSANQMLRAAGKSMKDIPTKIYFDIMLDLGGIPKKIRGIRFRNIRRCLTSE